MCVSERVCGLPPNLNSGYLSAVTGVESGDTATYECIPGFQLLSFATLTCQNGTWGSPPICAGKKLYFCVSKFLISSVADLGVG